MEEQTASQGEVVLKVKQVCGAKWTGDVSISLDATAADLKSKLQNLTGQPLHTMKLMCSGKYDPHLPSYMHLASCILHLPQHDLHHNHSPIGHLRPLL
jgi:hypothetical protein